MRHSCVHPRAVTSSVMIGIRSLPLMMVATRWLMAATWRIRERALDAVTLVNFIQSTQPKAWERFERMCNSDPVAKFVKVFDDAVDRLGMVAVLKHGFKHRGIAFKVAFFQPESGLNESAAGRYSKNVCRCIRQFHFAPTGNQTIDMVLDINGIPVVGIELKDQFTGQDVEDAMRQW